MKKLTSIFVGLFLLIGLSTSLSAAEKCGTSKCGDTKVEKPKETIKTEKCGASKCGG